MPLAFSSTSHGTVAFGFFNIQTDMLLLEELFFFADRFCRAVVELVRQPGSEQIVLPGWRIAERRRIGNLHGAIDGVDRSGFIGATYARWPFPSSADEFKQSPEGARTQPEVEAMITDFGQTVRLSLGAVPEGDLVAIGEYRFDWRELAALIAYVDRGGYPRWRGGVRPDYVVRMMDALAARSSPLSG